MLDRERQFYAAHVGEWIKTHPDRFVLIKEEDVIGFFDTLDDALAAGAARFGLSSFLVRRVGQGEEAVTIPALTLGLLGAHS